VEAKTRSGSMASGESGAEEAEVWQNEVKRGWTSLGRSGTEVESRLRRSEVGTQRDRDGARSERGRGTGSGRDEGGVDSKQGRSCG
jgi:hypothetical protein